MLIIDDDALLRRAEKRHLEWLCRRSLHRRDDALKHWSYPLNLALHHCLVEGLVFRAVAGRSVRSEPGQVLGDKVEDRFELEARRFPLIVLSAVSENIETGLLLGTSTQLARVFVS